MVVVMSGLMIVAIVALELFHPGDNMISIGHILTIGIPTTAALLSLIRSSENGRQIEQAARDRKDDV